MPGRVPHARSRSRPRDARGLSGSVQWAMLLPLVLMTVLGAIQVGLWAHGRTVAAHAAVAGAEEAALLGATAADGQALAARVATGGGLTGVLVEVGVTADEVRVVVSGRMPTFVDLGQTRVREQATRPRELVTRP